MNATATTTTTFDITTLNRRSDPECPTRRQVQCTGDCHGWFNLIWNNNAQCFLPINCHRCNIDLVPEPAAQKAATPQEVAGLSADELLATVNAELAKVEAIAATQEEITATQAHLLRPDDADQIVYFIQLNRRSAELAKADENATEAEPGPAVEPVALRPVRPEQKAYFVTWATSSDASKKYALLCSKVTGMAINCSCPSRTYRKGRACKHMMAHNAMLTPATKAAQAA